MRRMCAWCGEVWEASRLEPPEGEPYLCPFCQGKETVLMKLREGGGADAGAEREAHRDPGRDPEV